MMQTRSDDEIRNDVFLELKWHPELTNPDDIADGWVTLEGTVDWQWQKALAESAVKRLKGVTGITNEIEVKPKVSPREVKEKIEEALRRSAELDARRITVEVDGGTVKLRGSVGSWA